MLPSDARQVDNFLEMLAAEKAVSKNTITAYRTDLQHYAHSLSGQSIVVTHSKDLKEYIQKLSQCGYAVRSLARKISVLRHFFAFLLSDGVISTNPALDLESPKRTQPVPKAMSRDDINKLLSCAHADQSAEGRRLIAMLELMYASGVRVSEMLSIKMTQLHHLQRHEPYIVIKGKGGKERLALLNDQAIAALQQYMEVYPHFSRGKRSEWLFPSYDKKGGLSALTRQRFGQLLKELAVKAQVNPINVAPHKIRHSFASHMLQNGADLRVVQELLGHADVSSTQIYTKVLAEQVQEFVRTYHPLAHEGNNETME